ncbi:transmembrane protein with metallophosphoesterase domain-related [Anaeramoeba flamelloides]|uniref:Transmembrane protein with metallophosphoesterase domain-related n=1 Tax=Anaeramoeba flamelloides TaxID=1746091 RepID=A0AAV8AGP2_9EUKA|nr:transmembrane protein with metallophosphoesterase domain-related [Anaeramoeba flamelloides]
MIQNKLPPPPPNLSIPKKKKLEVDGKPLVRIRVIEEQTNTIKPSSGEWNALTISDLHFSDQTDSYFPIKKINETIRFLKKTIKSERVDQLIILGDLFHSTCSNMAFMERTLKKLTKLTKETFMIGGNHDRGKISRLQNRLGSKYLKKKKIHLIENLFLCLTPSDLNQDEISSDQPKKSIKEKIFPRVILTHDAGNESIVSSERVEKFLRSIKHFHEWINPSDLLIMGHTHLNYLEKAENMGSQGPFHASLKTISCGRITETQSNGGLKFKLLKLHL